MTKYKYYFRKPRSEIIKDILKLFLISGAICIAANSPYFVLNILKNIKRLKKYPKEKISDSFYQLRKKGLLNIKNDGKQIYISLTPEGKKKAGWLQIDSLMIRRPKKWDGKWRLVIFDISQLKKHYREALRGKLKELGFCRLQKSIWIYPFYCKDELELLEKFFGLTNKEIRLITAEDIGDDKWLRKYFKLI